MSLKKAGFRGQRYEHQWVISALAVFVALLLLPLPGNTKEERNNTNLPKNTKEETINIELPPAPDNGSPEEDFSAGGTRNNRSRKTICGVHQQQFAYLLGNRNREFTADPHPTFWFYIPHKMHQAAQMSFVLTELETGKKIYERSIEKIEGSGITGVDLPREKQYALSPTVNYAWSLTVNCGEDQETAITLEGWLTRLAFKSNLQNQLATTDEVEKHKVYLQHNLLYDALTELAQHRIAKPNNQQTKIAWNQLLATLGWPDLIEQRAEIHPQVVDMQISAKEKS